MSIHMVYIFLFILCLLNLNLSGKKEIIQISIKLVQKHDFVSNIQFYSKNKIFYKINTDFYTSPAQKI